MHVISVREDSTSSHRFASNSQVRRVDDDYPLLTWQEETSDLLLRVRGGHVLAVVHGFNVTVGELLNECETLRRHLEHRLSGVYDEIVAFTWPGGAARRDYFSARSRVAEAGERLRRWLARIGAQCNSLDLVTHSLGARVARAALYTPEASFSVRNVFALAPAVDWDVFSREEKQPSIPRHRIERLYLLCAQSDPVLSRWYPLFEWKWALGAAGPDDPKALARRWPNVEVVPLGKAIDGHNGYVHSEAVYDLMARALERSRASRRHLHAPHPPRSGSRFSAQPA